MKTALERALERIEEQGIEAGPELTAEEKQELSEISKTAEAKIAEREIVLTEELRKAALGGDVEKLQEIHERLMADKRSVGEHAEADREKIIAAARKRQEEATR